MNGGTAPEVESETAVTVVVATHNRAALLPRLIRALEEQVDAPPFDIMIVDDGSRDATPTTLAELTDRSHVPIRHLRQEVNSGPARARNRGWRASSAEVIAFTDDDCVPHPAWLGTLVAAIDRADIVQGSTLINPDIARVGLFPFSPHVTYERGHYETCNIAYRRSVLESVGGFDECFASRRPPKGTDYRAPVWGEDTDLAWRAKEQGARTTFVAEAIVWHDPKPGGTRDRLRDLPRRAGMAVVIKRHPQLRDQLTWRCFTEPSHPRVLLALAGLVALACGPTRRSRWLVALLAFAPWTVHRASFQPWPMWHLTLPRWFVLDVAEVVVMARASAKERTPLL